MKMTKKVLSLLLSVIMVLGVCAAAPFTVSAEDAYLRVGDEHYSVTLRAGSADFEYDGTEKVVDYFADDINTNDNGDVLITIGEHNYRITGYSVYTSLTNAGDVATNVITTARPIVYDEDNNDVSAKFTINTAPGRLEVSKRQVTLTSEGGVKEYDGSPLVNATVTATNLIPNNYDITGIQAVGRQVYVGSSPNTILYTIRTDVENNYDIHVIEGTLTVNNRSAKYEITVTAGSAEKLTMVRQQQSMISQPTP